MKAHQPTAKRMSAPIVRKAQGGTSALQTMADQSPASQKLAALQRMADARRPVQRMEEDELQMKPIQRIEEDELQMKPIQRMEEDELQGKFIQRAEAPKANNTGLPDNLKAGIESLSGMSMDHVKVHRNSDKPAAVQAHAYAQGSDIHLGPGQEKHLPHEAWHVVQQAQGRVKPTMQLKGIAVNDDAGLEKEADVMGAKASQLKSSKEVATSSFQSVPNNVVRTGDSSLNSAIQRAEGHKGLGELKAAIHEGTGRAKDIAESLYAFDGPGDGDYTNKTRLKIKATARAFGYPIEHAIRLAYNIPFVVGDIEANTKPGDVEGRSPTRQMNPESFKFSKGIQSSDDATVSIHQLHFDNVYEEAGEVSMNYNARNPALAKFFASDVVAKQREIVGRAFNPDSEDSGPVAVTHVIRSDVQSDSGRTWWDALPEEGAEKFKVLTADELEGFMTKTVNGKSTKSAFRGQYDVTSGRTIRYADDNVDQFSVKLGLTPKV